MDKQQAEARIKDLKAILMENSRRYYVDNAPVISDYEYDHLLYELEDLEARFPEYKTADSPTATVGSDLKEGHKNEFEQYPHKYPMLSLGNTYSIQEVEEFANRAEKVLECKFTYCCELKFDGTAICLTYKNGELYRALTRGDGSIGDDVTHNVLKIKNIPRKLHGNDFPNEFEIRGEILMPYEAFERLNKQRIEDEEAPFANPRNAASGSLKLLDSGEVGRRGLWCTLYHMLGENLAFATQDDTLKAAARWGLPISQERRICRNIDEIKEFIDYWDTQRKFLPFATDGIVIKINEKAYQEKLGYTSKFPRWAVAYKFKAEQALTELLSIDYQVGRTGAITPVANLSPVQLSGTVVKRATLNNADQMELLDIHEGDYVYVEKGGEIIPKIVSVELSKRRVNAIKPKFPKVCPDCGCELIKEEGQAKYFCPNSEGCPTQIKGKLLHFLSRKAMNIIAGEATVEQLFNKNLVRKISDFYSLSKYDLLTLEGWKEKSAERFLKSIEESLKIPFSRVLFAIGIRYVGEQTAKLLAENFENIDAIINANKEELLAVGDIGEIIAQSIVEYFKSHQNIEEITKLKNAGLKFSKGSADNVMYDELSGISIVISGTFGVSREEIKELIERHGGKNSSSLSSKTSYLLAGEKPGPEKIKKAQELDIEIIDEQRFFAIIGGKDLIKKKIGIEEPTLF